MPQASHARHFRWQGLARFGLAVGLLGFGTVVFLGVRQRVEPVSARVIDRLDPEAVIESTGAELMQIAGGQENFELEATRQLTYSDGSVRFVEGVTLRVTERPDRASFVLTGVEASANNSSTDVNVSGDVRLAVSDGLGVRTNMAAYQTDDGLITMPGPTTLTRKGLEASGRNVVYSRELEVVNLREMAQVRLTGEEDRAVIVIQSARATLAHADGYMYFDGATEIRTEQQLLSADETMAHFGEDETMLQTLELRGNAKIQSTEPVAGELREMRATGMTLEFEEMARLLKRVRLTGASAIEFIGADGNRGARIGSSTMDVTMASHNGNVTALVARDDVHLQLPDTPNGSRQEIRASALTGSGTQDSGLTAVRFDEGVEYLEQSAAKETHASVTRLIRAKHLEAGVEEGLSALLEARFQGNVRFSDGSGRQAAADEALYDLLGGLVTLTTGNDTDRRPTLIDATSTIEAQRLELALDGSTIEGSGGVRNVLTPGGDDSAEPTSGKMSALFDDNQQVFVTADAFRYDGDAELATYTGQARMWQGETSFEGDSLVVDDQTGNLTANGNVRTSIQLIRLNEATQPSQVSLTRADGDTFQYDNVARQATYTTGALMRSDYGDLKADTIVIFLEEDGRSLDRLEATGDVKLRLDSRWATGERLVYTEAEGRYEMAGVPVEIVEEIEPEDRATAAPQQSGATLPQPSCRSTKGRALTFYRSTDTLAVDGREELRTQTNSGDCNPLTF